MRPLCYKSHADSVQHPSRFRFLDGHTEYRLIATKLKCTPHSNAYLCHLDQELGEIFANVNAIRRSSVLYLCSDLLDLGTARLDHGFWFRVEWSHGTASTSRCPSNTWVPMTPTISLLWSSRSARRILCPSHLRVVERLRSSMLIDSRQSSQSLRGSYTGSYLLQHAFA